MTPEEWAVAHVQVYKKLVEAFTGFGRGLHPQATIMLPRQVPDGAPEGKDIVLIMPDFITGGKSPYLVLSTLLQKTQPQAWVMAHEGWELAVKDAEAARAFFERWGSIENGPPEDRKDVRYIIASAGRGTPLIPWRAEVTDGRLGEWTRQTDHNPDTQPLEAATNSDRCRSW